MDVDLAETTKESTASAAGATGARGAKSMELRLAAIQYAAKDTSLFELHDPRGNTLPPFTAGAHIDLALPNGLVRQYSLVNPQNERHRYVVGVKLDRNSRGGSRFMHEGLRVGTSLPVSGPRNNFPLVEDASHVVLLAGGIGITPIWCLAQRLIELGRSWEIHYASRNREEMAFHRDLAAHGARANFHFDEESGGKDLDIAGIVAKAPPGTHFYCCGPKPMLAAFESATGSRPPECVHLERFTANEPRATEGGFTVVLQRSGKELVVSPGKTILQTVRDAGVEVESSCEEGVCMTCATGVISGIPDHRDSALSAKDKEENKIMLICCSGSRSERLVLDL